VGAELRALFAPLTLRRALVLLIFAGLVLTFRRLLPMFVFFVAFERSIGWCACQLRGRGMSRSGALAAVLVGLLGLVVAATALGSGSAVQAFFDLRDSLPERIAAIRETELYRRLEQQVDAEVVVRTVRENAAHALGYLAAAGHLVLEALLGLILAIVYLVDEEDVASFQASCPPASLVGTLLRFLGYAADAVAVTLQFQVVVAACNAVLTLPVLLLVGIPHTSAFLLVVFVSGVIPVVGNFLSGAVLTILAYQAKGWAGVAIFSILTAVLHKLESYYLNPRLAARHVRLPGFVLVVSLVLWETLLGFAGLFVSFPFLYLAQRIRVEFQEEDAARA
jgi:predicted PurR-regulated permease PerM